MSVIRPNYIGHTPRKFPAPLPVGRRQQPPVSSHIKPLYYTTKHPPRLPFLPFLSVKVLRKFPPFIVHFYPFQRQKTGIGAILLFFRPDCAAGSVPRAKISRFSTIFPRYFCIIRQPARPAGIQDAIFIYLNERNFPSTLAQAAGLWYDYR